MLVAVSVGKTVLVGVGVGTEDAVGRIGVDVTIVAVAAIGVEGSGVTAGAQEAEIHIKQSAAAAYLSLLSIQSTVDCLLESRKRLCPIDGYCLGLTISVVRNHKEWRSLNAR